MFYPLNMSTISSPFDSSLYQKNQAELQTADQMKHFREASYDKHKYNWVGSAWNNDCKVGVTHPRLRDIFNL